MGLLQYTSNEMFSATELVRKNKNIFDKLNKKEIEKAVILRDGKPNVILLDFNEYEKIIDDYLKLKDFVTKKEKKIEQKTSIVKEDESKNEDSNKIENSYKNDFSFDTRNIKDKEEALKEFWD